MAVRAGFLPGTTWLGDFFGRASDWGPAAQSAFPVRGADPA